MDRYYSYHRLPKRGWSARYRYLIDGALELLTLLGLVAVVLFVVFAATWTGQ